MIVTSIGVNWSANLPWWCWAVTVALALGFGLQLLKIDGPDSNKAAAKLFQWSITYLSVFSLLLVVATLI